MKLSRPARAALLRVGRISDPGRPWNVTAHVAAELVKHGLATVRGQHHDYVTGKPLPGMFNLKITDAGQFMADEYRKLDAAVTLTPSHQTIGFGGALKR